MAAVATVVVALMSSGATAGAVEVEPGVDWTTIVREHGPERINVLTVDPARVRAVLSNERVAGRERVSAMARRVGAVAGVNGGFFAANGDPVGVLAIDGELLSEPVDGRSALILPGAAAQTAPKAAQAAPAASQAASARPRIARLGFSGRMYVNGRSREIDGVDRRRGLIPACGGRGGDVPTERPNPAITCVDGSELVLLSPRYGRRPPAEGGVEAIVRDGTVTRLRPPGTGRVPKTGLLLTGTGDAARFLRNNALPRSRARIALTLLAGKERVGVLPGGGGSGGGPVVVVGAGPRILRAGEVAVAARREGFAPSSSFFGSFVASRQARTLAGVRGDGSLLLVTVDGGAPGWSAGMTLRGAARLMRSLGARDALNLAGGGSSTMAVRGQVVNRPSDPGGERRVSDGLFAMP